MPLISRSSSESVGHDFSTGVSRFLDGLVLNDSVIHFSCASSNWQFGLYMYKSDITSLSDTEIHASHTLPVENMEVWNASTALCYSTYTFYRKSSKKDQFEVVQRNACRVIKQKCEKDKQMQRNVRKGDSISEKWCVWARADNIYILTMS